MPCGFRPARWGLLYGAALLPADSLLPFAGEPLGARGRAPQTQQGPRGVSPRGPWGLLREATVRYHQHHRLDWGALQDGEDRGLRQNVPEHSQDLLTSKGFWRLRVEYIDRGAF